MKLIVGLGNPGEEYKNTRHNMGFLILDRIKKQIPNSKFQMSNKFKAQILKTKNLILAKPQTFMNKSGEAVAKISQFYKIKPEDIWIIHDDLDIEIGQFKIQLAKGPQRHNGILSVEEQLGSKDFWRARIGIAQPETERQACMLSGKEYVLSRPSAEEAKKLDQVADQVGKEIKEQISK